MVPSYCVVAVEMTPVLLRYRETEETIAPESNSSDWL